MTHSFTPASTITLMINEDCFQQTLAFYRDILLLNVKQIEYNRPDILLAHEIEFGSNILILFCVKQNNSFELELTTEDLNAAFNYLQVNEINTTKANGGRKQLNVKDPSGNKLIITERS
ncbi:hypothetical protein HP439_07470 [Sphingobacterium shayense]|uniref:hypothetical protein n=1 Tax=Sphingobacterium shayense TaxID=626343 RepID=UPI001554F579|nr:hypothetical protein [Sphingobacterium shayense]NQD70555.1 hypothetical protein [Sphingobacterium shayense]